jgi:hypothetical protein
MPTIIDATSYETEERLYFAAPETSHQIIVVSGYALIYGVDGNPDEDFFSEFEAHLTVGPYLEGIQHVSPLLAVASLNHPDSDTDDASGWYVSKCPWDIVSGLDGVPPSYERVLLRPVVGAKGENASINTLGYHVVIEARSLVDIMEPGPAHY